MTSPQQKASWLRAIREAASQQQIPLPPFTHHGMGSAICRDKTTGRFVSYKRRLVCAHDAEKDGIEWTLWLEEAGLPNTVASFREPLVPTPDRVGSILAILRGWLIDQWTLEAAQQAAASHPDAKVGNLRDRLARR